MRPRAVFLVIIAVAALLVFGYVLRQLSFISVGLAANQEVQELLRQSADDQKKLSKLDRAQTAAYRQRFDQIQTLLQRMHVLALTRGELRRQFELVLLAVVAAIVLSGAAVYLLEQRSRLALDRRRTQYLEHLSAWQEAARRHAHEIRTPLTAAQLEIDRLVRTIERRTPEATDELREARESIFEELEQLRRFTRDFVSFAQIGTPRLQKQDVAKLVSDFRDTFAEHYPSLVIDVDAPQPALAELDRELVRRVLVNLATNSALAVGEKGGMLSISVRRSAASVLVDVRDDGPGIPPAIRGRLFEPYVTTRSIGEGMGLGLAISRKIMLDHGGDLDLLPSPRGTAFRLTFPSATEDA